MHELKRLLDEIPELEKNDNETYMPNQVFDFNLLPEEIVLYMAYCYLKSNDKQLPGIDELARLSRLKPGLVKITMAALTEKGITFD